jgi:hypothetical protein
MIKIPLIYDFLKEYIVIESYEDKSAPHEIQHLKKGIKFKISKIDGYYATLKITSSIKECDSLIVDFADSLKSRCIEDISTLQHSLELWNNSPEQFVEIEKQYGTNKFTRVDGVKPKFSYQVSLNTFENKEWYENVIKEKEEELKTWTTFNNDSKKYLYDIIKNKKNIQISVLNKVSFDFFDKNKTAKKPPFPLNITGKELNEVLGVIFDGTIDDDDIEEVMEETGVDISPLKDWEFDCESDGEMYNDSQIVTYTITFTSPEKHEYSASNSHNAIRGWDFSGKIHW